jgi:selenoprotein W-related protein
VLIPSKGGVFEFTVNGELLFSKKQLDRHAEPGEIRDLLLEKLETLRSTSD